MSQQKPHVLLLINDEHRPDVLPIEGDRQVRTPTLDRFINEGTYFRNAYTPSPICVPARQSFISGLYPRNELWRAQNGPSVMIKQDSLKYFRFDNGAGWPEQLFDLSNDPDERNNLIDNPTYAQALESLRGKVDALPPPRRKDADNRFIDPYRPMAGNYGEF